MSVSYSLNWMGPVSMQWYRDRGLTKMVSEVLEKDQVFGNLKEGDTWTHEEITTHYSAGRIDIRDSSKEGYDGWDEYAVSPMHAEDWHHLGEWLWELTTDEVLPYNTLLEMFQEHYDKEIRWIE